MAKFGNFSKKQGVDNVYDGQGSAKKGIWGINDVDLLKNVLDKVDSNEKSLNLILTISNHPPFEENVFEYGFNFDIELYKSKMNYSEKSLPAKALGHIWYADKAIGSLLRKQKKNIKNPYLHLLVTILVEDL